MGVRTDDQSTLGALREAYQDLLVDDPRAASDYAVSTTGGPRAGSPRLLPYVAHGRCPLLRSRDHARLLRRLDLELGALVRSPVPRTVRVYGMSALVGAGGAALVPTPVIEGSSAIEEQVRHAGFSIVEAVAMRLDPVRQEILALPGLVGDVPPPFDDVLAVSPGRWPVRGVFWRQEEMTEEERPALALVRLLTRIEDRFELDRGTMLGGVADMVHVSSAHGLRRSGVVDLEPVVSLLS